MNETNSHAFSYIQFWEENDSFHSIDADSNRNTDINTMHDLTQELDMHKTHLFTLLHLSFLLRKLHKFCKLYWIPNCLLNK